MYHKAIAFLQYMNTELDKCEIFNYGKSKITEQRQDQNTNHTIQGVTCERSYTKPEGGKRLKTCFAFKIILNCPSDTRPYMYVRYDRLSFLDAGASP